MIPVDNILFASEMSAPFGGTIPETGHYNNDTKRYVEALTPQPRGPPEVFEGNAGGSIRVSTRP